MEQNPGTVSELEAGLQRSLTALREIANRGDLPRDLEPLLTLAPVEGASVHVSLRQRETGRPLRPASTSSAWSPRACGAWIVFELGQGLGSGSVAARIAETGGDPLRDFITALDHVERDPHLRFVSLKWFRDTYLAKRGHAWAHDPDLPRRLVHQAADTEMILTSKVSNPKAPEFPVTSIRLNRNHPEVRRILEELAPRSTPAPEPPTG